MSLTDVRIPADASDKQTTDARSALPPIDFVATKKTTFNLLQVYDRRAPQDRAPTTAYRIYFLPAAFAPSYTGTSATVPLPVVYATAQRVAGRRVASLVAEIAAPGLGTILPINDAVNFGAAGYYFCVGVNRVKIEAPVENMVAAPV